MYFTKVFYSNLDSHEKMIPWLLSKIPLELLQQKGENKIEVAFDELLTNIYEHGYKTRPFPIFLKVVINDKDISFEIRDMGEKFDLLSHEKNHDSIEPPIGGLGITFIKAAFADLVYEYSQGFNVIRFILF